MTPTQKIIKNEVYQIIDSFLVEAKDQNGNERSLIQLNLDRKLAAERFIELFNQIATEAIEAVRLETKKSYYRCIIHRRLKGVGCDVCQKFIIQNCKQNSYNSAIYKMEQKAKKFLKDNF